MTNIITSMVNCTPHRIFLSLTNDLTVIKQYILYMPQKNYDAVATTSPFFQHNLWIEALNE